LLFAKDLPRYRKQVAQFYADIQQMPPLSDADITNYMKNLSMVGEAYYYNIDFLL